MKTNLATFDHLFDAQGLAAFLQSKGVDAKVEDERRLQRFWFMDIPIAGVHVLVPTAQYDQAHALAEQGDGASLIAKAVHCPACNSCRVHYPAVTRKNVLPAIAARILIAVGVMKHEYYCEDCHHTWSPLHSKVVTLTEVKP